MDWKRDGNGGAASGRKGCVKKTGAVDKAVLPALFRPSTTVNRPRSTRAVRANALYRVTAYALRKGRSEALTPVTYHTATWSGRETFASDRISRDGRNRTFGSQRMQRSRL